jgi:hypothetical protein
MEALAVAEEEGEEDVSPTVRCIAYRAAIQALALRTGMQLMLRDSVPMGTRQMRFENSSCSSVMGFLVRSPRRASLDRYTWLKVVMEWSR